MNQQITMIDAEGWEVVVDLPARYEICSHCRGAGASSAYLGAFTRDDMDEAGPDFAEDYFAGRYDRTCDHCQGTGKVLHVEADRCVTKEQKAALEWMREDQRARAEERRHEG